MKPFTLAMLLTGLSTSACVVGADATSEPPLSFDAFVAKYVQVTTDNAGNEALVYDWDQRIASRAQLDQLYSAYRTAKTTGETLSEATVMLNNGQNDRWSPEVVQNLSYCVSDAFGGHKSTIVSAMIGAGDAWAQAANGAIRFVYHPEHDANCTNTNNALLFNVVPSADTGGGYAVAFFPGMPRDQRQLVVYTNVAIGGAYPLDGIMRHELGHTLGLRHETARGEGIARYGFHCFEDVFFRPLTTYDENSVMTTPACMGDQLVNKALTISGLDQEGIRLLYN